MKDDGAGGRREYDARFGEILATAGFAALEESHSARDSVAFTLWVCQVAARVSRET